MFSICKMFNVKAEITMKKFFNLPWVVCCSLDVLADNRVKAFACHFFVEMGELNDNGCDITQV